MAYEHEEGTASMFQNDYKEDGDKKPDYTGKGKVDGGLKNFALWKRKTKDGKPVLFVKWSDPQDKFQSKNDKPSGNSPF